MWQVRVRVTVQLPQVTTVYQVRVRVSSLGPIRSESAGSLRLSLRSGQLSCSAKVNREGQAKRTLESQQNEGAQMSNELEPESDRASASGHGHGGEFRVTGANGPGVGSYETDSFKFRSFRLYVSCVEHTPSQGPGLRLACEPPQRTRNAARGPRLDPLAR
jgi:hypothetical protein